MKKLIILGLLLLQFSIFHANIILDKIDVDENNIVSLTIHNINDPALLKLLLDNKDFQDFKIKVDKDKLLMMILVDNSGSIILDDFFEIRSRVDYFIKNLSREDFIQIYKVNDKSSIIYPLAPPAVASNNLVKSLVREGQLSKIYDSIIAANIDIKKIIATGQFKDFYPYVILFSDGDDVGSKNRNIGTDDVVMYDDKIDKSIPFFYFSYDSIAKESKNLPLIKLANETKGERIIKPSETEIQKLFFNRQKRATISFTVNKNEIIKRDTYYLDIIEKDNKLRTDLRALFTSLTADKDRAGQEDKDEKDIPVTDLTETGQTSLEEKSSELEITDETTLSEEEIKKTEQEQLDTDKASGSATDKEKDKKETTADKEFKLPGILKYILLALLIILILLILLFIIKKILDNRSGSSRSSGGGGSKRRSTSFAGGGTTYTTPSSTTTPSTKLSSTPVSTTTPTPTITKEIKKDITKKEEIKSIDDKKSPTTQIAEQTETTQKAETSLKQQDKVQPEEQKLTTIAEETSLEEKIKAEELKKQEAEKISLREKELAEGSGDRSFFYRKQLDLVTNKRYNKFSVFHNEGTRYVDDVEHTGEEVITQSKLKVLNVDNKIITVSGTVFLLLDEIINIKKMDFKTRKIKYDKVKKAFQVTLELLNSKKDLTSSISVGDSLECTKKTQLFGSPNAIVEKMIANKKQVFYDFTKWKSANGKKEGDQLILSSKYPLILDTIFEVKYLMDSSMSYQYYVTKITREKGKYNNILKLRNKI